MALDGLTIYAIVDELNHLITNGKIDKIYQPENDELILSIRNQRQTYKLLLTSHSSSPKIHITKIKKDNPMQPPMFCMLLRKHLTGGRIVKIKQLNFDRIIEISIETTNELGDICIQKLIIEIMGKHSNIILVDENKHVVDSIKHITNNISSVREVLPNKEYILPPSKGKLNPLKVNSLTEFTKALSNKSTTIYKALYLSFNGISPIISQELCYRSRINSSKHIEEFTNTDYNNLYQQFHEIFLELTSKKFHYNIILNNEEMIDFSPIYLTQFENMLIKQFDSISNILEYYYKEKDIKSRIKQKSQDLHKLVQNTLERCYKKKNLQLKQLEDTKNRGKWKLYGELITANIYSLNKGMSSFKTINYYDENQNEIIIPLEHNLTPSENSQKYFKKYNKAKRTNTALQKQLEQTNKEIEYLQTITTGLDLAVTEQDIHEIRQELHKEGYIKKLKKAKKNNIKSQPLSFLSSEGLKILVGKNNIQNDNLTFKIASTSDLWFHVKDMPGSHTILFVKNNDYTETSILEAAKIAAYHSKGKLSSNVPVDYTQRRFVKKPNGAKPGYVIYTNQKTLYVTPFKNDINKLENN